MRNKLVIILLLLMPTILMAQKKVKKFEFELGPSHSFAAPKVGASEFDYDMGFYLEGRFNLNQLPIDIGLQLKISKFDREYVYSGGGESRSCGLLAVGDYQFRRTKRVNPFVGMGAGVVFGNQDTGIFNYGYTTSLCVMPRVGIRFFRHITVSLDYVVTKNLYSHANMNLGVHF